MEQETPRQGTNSLNELESKASQDGSTTATRAAARQTQADILRSRLAAYADQEQPHPAEKSPVLCEGCGGIMPPAARTCAVCGTHRYTTSDTNYRIATAAPGLARIEARRYDPYAYTQGLEPAPEAEQEIPSHLANVPLFEYQPGRERQRAEEDEKPEANQRDYRRVLLLGVGIMMLMSAAVLGWQMRHETRDFFAMLKHQLLMELGFNDNNREPAPTHYSAPRTAPHLVKASMHPSRPVVHVRRTAPPVAKPVIHSNGPTVVKTAISPMRVSVNPRASLALLLHEEPPVYPAQAIAEHVEGDVYLKAVIGADGLVKGVEVISGDPLLIAAACEAVMKWRYRPYYRDGLPMEMETTVVVNFSLAQMASASMIMTK